MPEFNAYRLVNDGKRIAVHAVAIDDSGAVVDWDRKPATFEVEASRGKVPIILALGNADMAAMCRAPMFVSATGELVDVPLRGGQNVHEQPLSEPA